MIIIEGRNQYNARIECYTHGKNNKVTNIEDNQYRGYVMNVCELNVFHFIPYIVYLNELYLYTKMYVSLEAARI